MTGVGVRVLVGDGVKVGVWVGVGVNVVVEVLVGKGVWVCVGMRVFVSVGWGVRAAPTGAQAARLNARSRIGSFFMDTTVG